MKFALKTIDAAAARAMLDNTAKYGFTNRPPTPSVIKKYAHDMREGNFFGDKTGETIKLGKFNRGSVVLDGQHRLMAVIEADVSVPMWVCEGVDPAMFQYIDGGSPRTLTQLMQIDGSPLATHAKEYAVAGYMLYKEDKTGNPMIKPGADDMDGTGALLDVIKSEYAIKMVAVAEEFMPQLRKAQALKIGPTSLLLYMGVQAMSADEDLFRKVIDFYANYGAVAPFNKTFTQCVRRCQTLYDEAKADGEHGAKVMPGRHKSLVDALLLVHAAAWNHVRGGGEPITSAGGFTKKFAPLLDCKWPGFQ